MADGRVGSGVRVRLVDSKRPAPPSFREMAAFAELSRTAKAARNVRGRAAHSQPGHLDEIPGRPASRRRRWWPIAK